MRIAIVVAVVVALVGAAHAESPLEKEARERFTHGQQLFDAASYDAALDEFQRSYALTKYPAILYKIALCQDQLGHNAEAIEAYKQYLAADPKTPRRKGIEARLEKLQAAATPTPPATPTPTPTPTPETQPTAPRPELTPPAPVVIPPAARAAETPPAPKAEAPVAATPAPALVAAAPPPPAKTPVYKKWWLWTAVGVVVAGAVVGSAVAATTPKDASAPAGAIAIHFPTASVAQ